MSNNLQCVFLNPRFFPRRAIFAVQLLSDELRMLKNCLQVLFAVALLFGALLQLLFAVVVLFEAVISRNFNVSKMRKK